MKPPPQPPEGDDPAASSFLSRWSRRKALARSGAAAHVPPASTAQRSDEARLDAVDGVGTAGQRSGRAAPGVTVAGDAEGGGAQPEQSPTASLTLDDASALRPDSDFRPFMARDVAPQVKNAALKRLFADPRFNVQDGLDVYIDDYAKPDPLPPAMLRALAQSRLLGLFDDAPAEAQPAAPAAGRGEDGGSADAQIEHPTPAGTAEGGPARPAEAASDGVDPAPAPPGEEGSGTATDASGKGLA